MVSDSAPRDGSLVRPAPRSQPIGESRYRSRRRAPPLGSKPAGEWPSPPPPRWAGSGTIRAPGRNSPWPRGGLLPASQVCRAGAKQHRAGSSLSGDAWFLPASQWHVDTWPKETESQFLCPARRGGKNTNSEMGSKG